MTEYPFQCINPPELGKPLGPYSQGLIVPGGRQLLQLSGQTPLREDGSVPEDMEAQADLVWKRIGIVLREAGLDYLNIFRVVTYLVDAQDAPVHAKVRARYLGSARPASTGIVVSQLFNPAYRLEVDVTAAWPA
ncbi:MAG: Rid family hydrolase [Ottowia sp.]|uniref:RidA family protein n=1 Tax=Ottowia sp. TaxID=1898956 RepID=UPI003C7515A5